MHNLSCGIIPLDDADDPPRVLLLRVYGYWDFPKGAPEANETPFEAARREFTEETGLTHIEFPWGEIFHDTAPYGRGKIARYYVGRVHEQAVVLPVSPELGRPEHHEARWVGVDEAAALLTDRVSRALGWALARAAR